MSATNKTAVYELPIFLGTDVPSWLTDWNGAMGDIDTAIAAAKAAADAAASTAGTAATDIVTINGQITSLQNTVGTHTTQIGTISGSINTINSLIGNGTPTTTDQTLIGAINELHANQGDLDDLTTTDKSSLVAAINEAARGGGGAPAASAVSYDNTGSGLAATNVQDVVDGLVIESTTAEVIGKDADGATIYRKVYKGTTLTNDQVLDASLTLSAVKSIRVNGSITTANNIKRVGFTVIAGNDEYWADVEIDSTGLHAKIRNITITSYYIVVEYTLTT